MPTRWVIGLAAGPSADGVDAAVVEIDGRGLDLKARVLHWLVEPYPRELGDLVQKASAPEQADVRQISLLHRLLGETFASTARQVADRASISLHNVLCIGCTGHTAWHEGDGRFPSTLPLGSAAIIAERTGLTAITDFRSRDQGCGGQGSPITALADHLLCTHPEEHRLLLHLGGLAYAIDLPGGSDPQYVVGWETGPCTVLLDALIQAVTGGKERHDAGGKHAVQGKQIPELLQRWTNHPFLLRRTPRSTHRSVFGAEFARQALLFAQHQGWAFHDVLCTANHFVALTIVESVRRHISKPGTLQRVLLSGGGVRNGFLWRLLEERFPGVPLERTDTLGVPAEAKEAVNAAVLACLTLDGVPANVPSATGAAGGRLLGSLTPGSETNWSFCLGWMTGRVPDLAYDED